jgi:multiple sugar transport system permease protein
MTLVQPHSGVQPAAPGPLQAQVPGAHAEPKGGPSAATIVLYVLLFLGLLAMVGPFIWMVLGSFKTQGEFLQIPPPWLPQNPTFDNYERLVGRLDFPRYFFNSTVVASVVTAANLVFSPMLGFALAKLHFRGKGVLMALVLSTLMLPAAATLVPLFVLMSKLDLVDTYPGLVLPFLAGPFGVFLTRQFFLGLPDELLEAARIDGAGELRTFFTIAMPLAGPVLATLGILTFLGSWNGFIYPLVMATSPEMYTLPVALATFATGQFQADHGMLMAGSVLLVVPVLIVFILLQRWITEGIATTGLKG